MAEATSSTSSASGDQWAEFWGTRMNDPHKLKLPDGDILDFFRDCNIQKQFDGLRLNLPSDILDLLNKTVGWDTPGDVKSAREMYTRVGDGLEDPSFNVEEELEKLQGLSSALGSKCDVFAEESERSNTEYRDYCQTRVEKLVEQAPRIKDMPGYEHEITWDEKLWIERALRKKAQKVKQVEDCAIYLEDFREEVRPMAEKVGEAKGQLGNARRLLKGVNEFIQMLATTEQRRLNNVVVSQVVAGDLKENKDDSRRYDKKRKRLESPTNVSRVVDKREVEEGLLKLLKQVSGKTLENNAADTEFMNRWGRIVNDFYLLSDRLSLSTG